jgi:hypothetical protein
MMNVAATRPKEITFAWVEQQRMKDLISPITERVMDWYTQLFDLHTASNPLIEQLNTMDLTSLMATAEITETTIQMTQSLQERFSKLEHQFLEFA